MGDYSATTWNEGAAPGISAAELNRLETQHALAVDEIRRIMKPPVVRWVIPGWAWNQSASQVVAANRTYYVPIYVNGDTTYDRIGIYVAVGDGAGGVADLRIFEWDTGVPGDLVLSAGTVNTNAGGAKEIDIGPTALTRGYYFLAVRCDQAPQLSGAGLDRGVGAPVGGVMITNAQDGPQGVVLYDAAAYSDPAGAVDGVFGNTYAFVRLREA